MGLINVTQPTHGSNIQYDHSNCTFKVDEQLVLAARGAVRHPLTGYKGILGQMTTADEALTAIDRRVQRQWRIEALLATVPLAIVAITLSFVLSWPPLLAGLTVLVGVALPAATLALVGVRYRHWRYELRDDILVLQHGVWSRQRSITPYYRVQNVDLTAGPLERWLGLQRLTIKTASSSTDATIPGLDKQAAKKLAECILLRAGPDAAV